MSILDDTTTALDPLRSASSLHLLLATHPDVADLAVGWEIGLDGEIWPRIPLRDPEGGRIVHRIAAALGLKVRRNDYRRSDGTNAASVAAVGSWGGATWHVVAYIDVPSPGVPR